MVKFENIHPDIVPILKEHNITEENLNSHYSDLYVQCPDFITAYLIREGGKWKSMAKVFTCNVSGKPTVDIAFGCMKNHFENRKEKSE